MIHKASPPSPELPHLIQPGAAHYLDLSELPACLSVRVSVSIRADDLSGPAGALPVGAPGTPPAAHPALRRLPPR